MEKARRLAHTFEATGPLSSTSSYKPIETTPVPESIVPDSKPSGLDDGVIAGIAVGSVLTAGIAGFAVIWFGVKKKNRNDLVSPQRRLQEEINLSSIRFRTVYARNSDSGNSSVASLNIGR